MKSTNTLMIMTVITVLLAANTTALSQISTNQSANPAPTATHEWSIESEVTQIDNAVKLTDAQKEKVTAALEERRTAIVELKAQKMEWKDRCTAAKNIREQTEKKITNVLTMAQYAAYDAARQKPSRKQ